ncbi:MAG: methyltransferase [Persephonella sp.]|nr:MAG: methyltransferase [Persephonella sp.]
MDIGKRFDQVANRYDTPDKIKRSEEFVKKLLELIPIDKNFKVMDIGAGTGLVDVVLSKYTGQIYAFDLSEGMLKVFEEKIKKNGIENIKIFKKDVLNEDFPERDFDLVITSMTFHHLDNPEEALRKIKDYLKDGGYVAIIDLEKEDGTFHSDNTDVKHFGFEKDDVKNWFEKNGFKDIKVITVYSIKKERNGKVKDYPVFLAVGQR